MLPRCWPFLPQSAQLGCLILGLFLFSLPQPARAANLHLLGYAAEWRYDHSGTNHGTAWREAGFDDSGWPAGLGVLGYPTNENLRGHAVIRTRLNQYISGTSGPQPITYYFRTRFHLTNVLQVTSLLASNLVDDGGIIYLNGQEVTRLALPSGAVDFQTLALRNTDIGSRDLDVTNIPPASLREGENVLAVEVHQGSVAGTDVIWGMSLWADVVASGPVSFLVQPSDQTNTVGSTVTLVSRVQGTRPVSLQWRKDGINIPNATNQNLVISNATVEATGRYSVTANNGSSSAISRTAFVTVLGLPQQLVPFNHVWRYESSATNLQTAWREPGYSDATWKMGPGPLGQESAAIPEPLRTVFPLSNSPTYYFRTHFINHRMEEGRTFEFLLELDDGAVVYLNGEEALRVGMPVGPITFGTPASRSVGDAMLESFQISSLNLRPGTNALAVEVHQVTPGNNDMVMGLRLTDLPQPPTQLVITNQPANVAVNVNGPAVFSVGVRGGTRLYQWFRDGAPIAGANSSSYRIEATLPADAARYSVVISNVFYSVRSREAVLSVLVDTNGPVPLDADGSSTSDQVAVMFSEPLTAVTATNSANFILTNVAGGTLQIFEARLSNGSNVLLRSEGRAPGQNYVLVVRGIEDQNGNSIANTSVPVASRMRLVNFDSHWLFYNPFPGIDEPDLGVEWRNRNYLTDDWADSDAGFWLGTIDTALPLRTQLSQGPVTTYFRTYLPVTFSPVGAMFILRHAINGGAVFHINGEENLRFNMPQGTVNYLTSASQEAPVMVSAPIALPAGVARGEDALLAVEVHASSSSDTTLFFACEVDARFLSLVGGPVLFTRDPPNRVLSENATLVLDPVVIGADRFQWLRDGQPILGATNPVFRMDPVTLATHGARFQLRAANSEFSALSGEGTVTINFDLEAPVVILATGDSHEVTVTFSEPVDVASALNPLHYSVQRTGEEVVVVSARMVRQDAVVLTLSKAFLWGDTLRIGGVTDTSQHRNAMAPTQIRVGFDGTLIPFSAEWRYDDSGADRGTAWRAKNFNDTAWPIGAALFGDETASLPEPIRTPLLSGQNGGPITTYFRARFFSPVAGASLILGQLVDDGAVYYLNGQEVFRSRVSSGQNYLSSADITVGDAVFEGPFNLSSTSLVAGENVLAVELHQTATPGSDIVFGAQLMIEPVTSDVWPVLSIRRQNPQSLQLSWEGHGYVLQQAPTLAGPWDDLLNAVSPHLLEIPTGTTNPVFFRLIKP